MHARIYFIALGLSLGCTGGDDQSPVGPDHTLVFEQLEHDKTYVDVPYTFDTSTQFRTPDVLETLDVRTLGVLAGVVYAGTPDGLFRLADSKDAFVRIGAGAFDDLEVEEGELIWAVGGDEVRRVIGDSVDVLNNVPTATLTAVSAYGAGVVAGGPGGVWRVTGSTVAIVADDIVVRDVLVRGETVFVAHENGVTTIDLNTGDRNEMTIDGGARAAEHGANGAVLVAGLEAILRLGSNGSIVEEVGPGRGSFPTAAFTAVVERDGALFAGHDVGASYVGAESIDHYSSLRWIPDQRVNDVAIDLDGDRWIATPAGITRVWFDTTTFAERAVVDEARIDDHWRMDGFVDDNMGLDDPYDFETRRTGDHDNDGLWTEMQIGAWCYAYAVTKNEAFYDKARRAMDVMFLQIDIPGVTFEAAGMKRGFITRSLVRDDEGAVFDDKVPRDNWHLQTYEGRDYYWKDDTSSDEYAGHYFGIPVFYDLCAKDEAEREAIRQRIRLTTDYLIDNDYLLIDLDGEPTLHGHWEDLGIAANGVDRCTAEFGTEKAGKCLESRHGGGWLNGAEILGHLLAAWHITGDPKYYDEYDRLFVDERYGKIVEVIEDTFTVTRPAFANHSDHELAMLAFTTLIRYEPNAERRARYEKSLLDFYEYEREEHNPWQIAVIGTVHEGDVDLDGAVQTLQHMPHDWRTWRVDNNHRVDADRWPNDRHGDPQFDRVFPYDEIRTMKWNGSPYVVAGGGRGRSTLAPTPYLLAYWMLRYYRMIE